VEDSEFDMTKDQGDAALIVQFYEKRLIDPSNPLVEGPVREFIKIMVPGDKNNIIETPVTDTYRVRFSDKYERFKQKLDQRPDGIPLEQTGLMSEQGVAAMRAHNIWTAEQMAALSDMSLQKIGPGARELQAKVKAYLEKNVPEVQALKDENATLKATLEELTERLSALETKKKPGRPKRVQDDAA
jgi:hypothetical protein